MAVSTNDRALISHAFEVVKHDVPLVTHPIAEREKMEYFVAFDGTMNDRTRIPAGEKETIVAALATRLGAHYYPGPGMQDPTYRNVLDGMIGYSSPRIADAAATDFLDQARTWNREHEDAEIRVVVTGFSRGAAIARHFMNLVDAAAARDPLLDGRVYFYAILFDTVSTGQFDSLQLSAPPSVDYLVHFVARDEPRFLFKPVVDDEPEIVTRTYSMNGAPIPNRINLVLLPGAHSDVGGSYSDGLGQLYRQLTEQLLYQMGLIEVNCWDMSSETIFAGKHDSRGVLDRLLGAPPPNSAHTVPRVLLPVEFPNPELQRAQENASRLQEMVVANAGRGVSTRTHWNETILPRLTLMRKGESLSVLDWEPFQYIDGSSFKYETVGNVRRLRYRFLPPHQDRASTLVIPDPVWDRLPESEKAVLSFGILRRGATERLATFVDDVFVEALVSNTPRPTTLKKADNNCGIKVKSESDVAPDDA